MIKKSELHEAKKKRKTVGTQTNRSNVEEGRKKTEEKATVKSRQFDRRNTGKQK